MKKRWHRGIALLAAACMCLMSVPVMPGDLPGAAIVASAETSGDFEYSVLEDSSVEISKYHGTDKTVEIPAEIDGKPVTSIGKDAFYCCAALASVTIPDSVTSIGKYAFARCTALESVTIPDSVTSIGDYAFCECTALASVTIPDSVTSFGNAAFDGTPWLQARREENPLVVVNGILIDGKTCSGDVRIPDGVTGISSGAFMHSSLRSVTIPESVTSIENSVFSDCTALESVTIPDSVTSIGWNAFYGCTSLASVTIPESVTSIGELAFYGCTALESVTILNPECEIYDNAETISGGLGDDRNAVFAGKIRGYDGSTAQAYAEKYGYTFVSLGEAPAAGLLGDVDDSGEVDSVDASLVLVAAAALGLDQPSGLDAEAEKRADVDGNGNVNSVDASIILTYAAAQGLSDTPLDLIDYVPKS